MPAIQECSSPTSVTAATTRWLRVTEHAASRMQSRGISEEDVETTILYGRPIYARKAVFKIIGRKEIEHYRNSIDLLALEGIHVVCSLSGDVVTVVTVYRRREFRRRDFYPLKRRARRKPIRV